MNQKEKKEQKGVGVGVYVYIFFSPIFGNFSEFCHSFLNVSQFFSFLF